MAVQPPTGGFLGYSMDIQPSDLGGSYLFPTRSGHTHRNKTATIGPLAM